MKRYVCGFVFDGSRSHVLLIRKTKPKWQQGMLNGIGGSIEPGESPMEAMRRESIEETGVDFIWARTIRLYNKDLDIHVGDAGFEVYFFRAEHPYDHLYSLHNRPSEHGEVLQVCSTETQDKDWLPNLHWLIPLMKCRKTLDIGDRIGEH